MEFLQQYYLVFDKKINNKYGTTQYYYFGACLTIMGIKEQKND